MGQLAAASFGAVPLDRVLRHALFRGYPRPMGMVGHAEACGLESRSFDPAAMVEWSELLWRHCVEVASCAAPFSLGSSITSCRHIESDGRSERPAEDTFEDMC